MLGQLRPALVVFNQLLVAAADQAALAALQADLSALDIPSASFAPAVVEIGPAAFEVDYDLALPLLYDEFCAALAALGLERPTARAQHRKEV